jgi:serine/threonine protein kinase
LVKTPEDKIVDGSYIKYIDYGLSCLKSSKDIDIYFSDRCYSRMVGTIKYFSPELAKNWLYLLGGKDNFNNYEELSFDSWKKCDLWALGILLYELFVYRYPYDIKEKMDDDFILKQIANTTGFENPRMFANIDIFLGLPDNIKNTIKNLLQINPNDRKIILI